jgi:hypothetical protein
MLHSGSKTTAAVATPEPLAATRTVAAWVLVQAKQSNTGIVIVGDSTVVAGRGTVLANPGDSVMLPWYGPSSGYDLNRIYLAVAVNGEGVDINYAA